MLEFDIHIGAASWRAHRVKYGVSVIRESDGNLIVDISVTFPQIGYDGKRVREE